MPSSYFSTPEDHLDPKLFKGMAMRPEVQGFLADSLMQHLNSKYEQPSEWTHAWLAGSGASYQWSANREPGDLDMLVGIDYPKFRMHNQRLAGLSDEEISRHVTDGFRAHLNPSTKEWNGYEVTWYSNPNSTDIRSIKPYAAYNLFTGAWDVTPDRNPQRPYASPEADRDKELATSILQRFSHAESALQNPQLAGHVRRMHQNAMKASLEQASALFRDVHDGRRAAFSYGGQGYSDPANYRWQAGKESGIVPMLKQLSDMWESESVHDQIAKYGVELPDVDTLLLRALVDER